jgi:hypothetical protein
MGLDVLKNNFQMFVLMIFWLMAGLFTGQGVLLFIPITIIVIFLNEKFPEILIGFIFILVLSDSLEDSMAFAKSFKNIYITVVFLFYHHYQNTRNGCYNVPLFHSLFHFRIDWSDVFTNFFHLFSKTALLRTFIHNSSKLCHSILSNTRRRFFQESRLFFVDDNYNRIFDPFF